MKNHLIAIAVFVVTLLMVALLVTDAAADPTKGIQVNYGGLLRAQPYAGLPANAIVGARMEPNRTAAFMEFFDAYRGEILGKSGGEYLMGNQTAYTTFNAFASNISAGQALGYWSYVEGLGKGNAMGYNGVVNGYGGGEIESGPDSIPQTTPVGEFSGTVGKSIFRGTITGGPAPGATTISYNVVANNNILGARAVFNKSHKYTTGTFQSEVAPGTNSLVTLAGSALLGLVPQPTAVANDFTGWYFKIGHDDDLYAPPCQGDDVNIGGAGLCVGHWYHVYQFVNDTQMILGYVMADGFDHTTPGQKYMLVQGGEPLSVDQTAHTMTFRPNGWTWSDGDELYSPASHVMMNWTFLIYNDHPYKDRVRAGHTYNSVSNGGIFMRGLGPNLESFGLLIGGTGTAGGYDTGIRFTEWPSGTTGVDMADISWTGAAISVGQSTGTNNRIKMGSGYLSDDGTNVKLDGHSVNANVGVAANGGGFKHITLSTGAVNAASTANVAVAWGTAFADATYTASCSVQDASGYLRFDRLSALAAGSVTADVYNADAVNPHTGTLHCVAMHP